MKQATYTLSACEKLISFYAEIGGTIETIEEGCLGLGLIICTAEGKKTAVIQEHYLNEWSSTHTIRLYDKTPKKYQFVG
jgi:hypothetical protein